MITDIPTIVLDGVVFTFKKHDSHKYEVRIDAEYVEDPVLGDFHYGPSYIDRDTFDEWLKQRAKKHLSALVLAREIITRATEHR